MSHRAGVTNTTPPRGLGLTLVIGATFVGASLYGFWKFLGRRQEKKDKEGNNPHCMPLPRDDACNVSDGYADEQLLAHVRNKQRSQLGPLLVPPSDRRQPSPPTSEYNPKHSTISQIQMDGLGENTRTQVPPPQRGQSDELTKVYTKSPDYASSHGKTAQEEKTT
ncbi:hypothetical protein AX15_000380 [Amanita polypyramis BW_CC]|nr:hypothetical protein AX15_000380 [Amanita polypyramis BW_CC]